MAVNLQKKQLSSAVKQVTDEMQVDTSGDLGLLEGENYSWDELNSLKDELGSGVLKFVGQVNSVVQNGEIVSRLGDQKQKFHDTVQIFFNDINEFSSKVKANRELHEHMSGKVNDLDEFDLYNRCAMTYHTLFEELSMLVTPTLSAIMIMITDIVDNEAGTEVEGQQEEVEGNE